MLSFLIKYNRKILQLLLVVVLFVSTAAGVNNSTVRKLNLAAMYYPMATTIHPVYKVYHNNDNTSLLFVKIFTNELMFAPSNVDGNSAGKVEVNYTLFEVLGDSAMIVADSGVYKFSIDEDIVGKRFYSQIPVKAETGKLYQLRVVAEDKLRKTINVKYIDVDKQTVYSAQNYNLTNHNDIPYFANVVKSSSLFRIKMRYRDSEKIYVKYYKHAYSAPKPTYSYNISSLFNKEADSLWVFDYDHKLTMQLYYEGYYLISADTSKSGGLLISNYGAGFPKVSSADEMIKPLQYITLKKEYDDILEQKNTKLAVDNFWIGKGTGMSRGRELIRIYYNRVYFSNYYFTSGVPGWASDRGMVYIMYGPPQKLERTASSEVWYYWIDDTPEPVKFNFTYRPSEYYTNDFVLNRTNSQEWHWQDALVAWRNGRIFLQD